jgi:hypothetical protein
VELKLCRDTDREGKLAQAVGGATQRSMQDADITATVHYIPLVIRVAGSIYEDLRSHLLTLGVNEQDLKATIKTIHLKTTNLLHCIYTTKQKRKRSKDRKAPWKRKSK